MSDANKPQNLRFLKASHLKEELARRGTLYSHPYVQAEMLRVDHTYDMNQLEPKAELKRLLHLECFGSEPPSDAIIIAVVARLVHQKNVGLVAEAIPAVLRHDANVKFAVLASAADESGKADEQNFDEMKRRFPGNVYFEKDFNEPLSKLLLSGADFTAIPSRTEPCGLVDYEASLLGTIVIGRATGGLAKVKHCGYLYEWYDISDRFGEVSCLVDKIIHAIYVYRERFPEHRKTMQVAMQIDASWQLSANRYLDLYLTRQATEVAT
jgi:starch synthase